MAYEKVTINQFMNAFFFEDRSVLTQKEVDEVYTEYIDKAKLYESEEFHKVGYITYLNGRVNYIKLFMRMQRDFIKNFDIPYVEVFPKLSFKYGYILKWNSKMTIDEFEENLKRIELMEKKYEIELEDSLDDLVKFRLKKRKKEETVKLSIESFVRTMAILKKLGWSINKEVDTMQELAIAIEEQSKEKK